MSDKKKWRDMSTGQRISGIAVMAAQLGLQGVVLADLHRRPEGEIRGNKKWWVAASFVNFVGPIAYLLGGRR